MTQESKTRRDAARFVCSATWRNIVPGISLLALVAAWVGPLYVWYITRVPEDGDKYAYADFRVILCVTLIIVIGMTLLEWAFVIWRKATRVLRFLYLGLAYAMCMTIVAVVVFTFTDLRGGPEFSPVALCIPSVALYFFLFAVGWSVEFTGTLIAKILKGYR